MVSHPYLERLGFGGGFGHTLWLLRGGQAIAIWSWGWREKLEAKRFKLWQEKKKSKHDNAKSYAFDVWWVSVNCPLHGWGWATRALEQFSTWVRKIFGIWGKHFVNQHDKLHFLTFVSNSNSNSNLSSRIYTKISTQQQQANSSFPPTVASSRYDILCYLIFWIVN